MYADQIDNDLRREIFLKLCKNENLTYSKLKPAGIESNQFAYHLKKLKEDGFIQKSTNGYSLAPKGLRLADYLSFKTEHVRLQPKIVLIFIIFSQNRKKVLVSKRLKQPQINKLVLPSGKLHFGETLKNSTDRMSAELFPFLDLSFSKCGSAWLKFSKNGICYSHLFAEVFVAEVDSKEELEDGVFVDTGTGQSLFWQSSNIKFNEEWAEGSKEVFEAAKSGKQFELDLEYNS